MVAEPVSCPRCGGLVQRLEDQWGVRLRCIMGCWQQDLNVKPVVRRTQQPGYKPAYEQGPHLPVTPSNYLPWREREQKAWEREA